MRYVVITGRPGVGKTTLFLKLMRALEEQGLRIAGFVCPEVRSGGRRVGFKIRSLDGKYEAWLARLEEEGVCFGARVGRYRVCEEAGSVAREVVAQAKEADIVAVDEVGPMELKTPEIRRAILDLLSTGKPGIFVVHRRLSDHQVLSYLRPHGVWYEVTLENRSKLFEEVYKKCLELFLRTARRRQGG